MYKLIDTEIAYVKCFSKSTEMGSVIRFGDDNIPDMYTHNFTLIKEPMPQDELIELITKEIENRRIMKKDFLQVEIDFLVEEEVIKALPILPEVTILDYMIIEAQQHVEMKGNEDCTIEEAKTEKVLRDGIEVDTLANSAGMGVEFAQRRIDRKAQVYKTAKDLSLYVCYHGEEPVGNCELFLDGKIAKIEDFEILEQYQRKGFGTAVLKHLINRAEEQGANQVYLITDDADTAKDMYRKCGFKLAGQKAQLHFSL